MISCFCCIVNLFYLPFGVVHSDCSELDLYLNMPVYYCQLNFNSTYWLILISLRRFLRRMFILTCDLNIVKWFIYEYFNLQ